MLAQTHLDGPDVCQSLNRLLVRGTKRALSTVCNFHTERQRLRVL
eukprot:SAG31_NODE_42584_length_271_cov_0.575581_1_plen_44_part_10